MRFFKDDKETEEIGKLFRDHPELAYRAFNARWRWQAVRAFFYVVPPVAAVIAHFPR